MIRYRPHLLVALLLSLVVLSGQLDRLREALLDARFTLLKRPASGDVVLVEIDPRSIEAVGRWPWPRSQHGQLIRQLHKAGVAEIIFDVDFSSASTPQEDAAFAAALQAVGGSVVLPAFRQRVADRGDGRTLHVNRPIPGFAEQAWFGLVDVAPDPDGVIRRYGYGALIENEFIPTVGSLLAGRHDQAAAPFRIDFGIQPVSVPTVSYIDVLRENPAANAALRGKKVIVSGTAAELGDRFTVPNGRIIPGSLVQALGAESIIQGRALVVTSRLLSLVAITALMAAMVFAWQRTSVSRRVLWLTAFAIGAEAVAIAVQAVLPVAADTSLLLAGAVVYAAVAGIDEIDLRGIMRLMAERRYERIAMSLSDGLICLDKSGRITLWNPGATAIFGRHDQIAIGKHFETLLAPGDRYAANRDFRIVSVPLAALQQPGGVIIELVGLRQTGEHFDLECGLSYWDTIDGGQYGVILRDISVKKQQQEHIRYLAECDVGTGLPNRNSLMSRLEQAVFEGVQDIVLLVVGIGDFHHIADLHGHAFGDAVIVAIAERLRGITSHAGFLARLGGDEFGLLLEAETSDAQIIGERIVASFEADPITIGERKQRVGVNIGIASSRSATHADALLGNVHFALAQAKMRRNAAPVHFDPSMRETVEHREALEAELRTALSCDEFELFYQPQINLRSGAVIGAEALIRWRHRERGYVSPGEFMPVINSTSLSEEVAAWVLETACRQAADWHRAGHSLRVGINLSRCQFASGDLAADVGRVLAQNGLPPHRLELEVTEDIILDEGDKTARTLAAVRALGVKVALDDFGTGYGSLAHLKALPIDTIKIDQSFVRNLKPGSDDAAIVAATISLGHSLGLTVIAEGIELKEVAGLLHEMGCDEGQGYLVSRPIDAQAFEDKFLAKSIQRVA